MLSGVSAVRRNFPRGSRGSDVQNVEWFVANGCHNYSFTIQNHYIFISASYIMIYTFPTWLVKYLFPVYCNKNCNHKNWHPLLQQCLSRYNSVVDKLSPCGEPSKRVLNLMCEIREVIIRVATNSPMRVHRIYLRTWT